MGSYSTTEKESLRVRLADLVSSQIREMSVGESIIIPSGYMNGNIYNLFGSDLASGHSITIKLVKEAENSFTIRLYNTAGVKHEKDLLKQNRVYPFIIQNIPPANLLDPNFYNETHKVFL